MATTDESKDFFISYTHRDSAWAEWIAWQLESEGYSTIIQCWDFKAGSNFVLEMDRGLKQAKRIIAVLSPNYLESSFAPPEWSAKFVQDPTGANARIIPVRVYEVSPTGLLAAIAYVDLVEKDEPAAKYELLSKVKQERAKPSRPPLFPGKNKPAFPTAPAHRSTSVDAFQTAIEVPKYTDQKQPLFRVSRVSTSRPYSQALWVYGAIVALAIREALTRVVPNVAPSITDNHGLIGIPISRFDSQMEAVRLIVFLATIARLYLRAWIYFYSVYGEDSDIVYPTKNYVMDFLIGIIQFAMFFVLSITLAGQWRFSHGLSGFLLILGFLLLYDVVWWFSSRGLSTSIAIRRWSILNLMTVTISLTVNLFLWTWQMVGDRTAEMITLVPIMIVTLIDFGEMAGGRNAITTAVLDLLDIDKRSKS